MVTRDRGTFQLVCTGRGAHRAREIAEAVLLDDGGFALHPTERLDPLSSRHDEAARSLNVIHAPGEGLPTLGVLRLLCPTCPGDYPVRAETLDRFLRADTGASADLSFLSSSLSD